MLIIIVHNNECMREVHAVAFLQRINTFDFIMTFQSSTISITQCSNSNNIGDYRPHGTTIILF